MLVLVSRFALFLVFVYFLAIAGCAALQRTLVFVPTHHNGHEGLSEWRDGDELLGYAREVSEPVNIWLMTHGNGGQASDRRYALSAFSERDSVFILEYPGYGQRSGAPSRESIDRAAIQAYEQLRRKFPRTPVCVVGESIGSGPASTLGSLAHPPNKIVLIVPFDVLAYVAADHFPYLPTRFLLRDRWDNIESLRKYSGGLEIFGARDDRLIAISHARALAASKPQAVFHEISGGHNEWAFPDKVKIGNP